MISERVKRQHQARRERGEVWGVTTGSTSKLPAETRALIISLRAEGMPLGKIAEHLTAEGVPTVSGGSWYASTVARVLNSPQTTALKAA
jgi:DNA invertase Pin-like site-specific DNA recombinase